VVEALFSTWMKPPWPCGRGGTAFPFVTETLRTEFFFTNLPCSGCFSLTDMGVAMNSGIRVRESIRS
jgi:hypothetical protein